MMERKAMNIEQTLEKFITEELLLGQRTKIDPQESLTTSGVIDSLSLLRLIAFIEETFNVQVEDTELSPDNFETLDLMVDLIEGKVNHK
jgi:acyl carrier protein